MSCDEKSRDETLMDNVLCHHLLEVEDDKISIVDGESCEFFVFVVFCSFASYELIEVFMSNNV